MRNYRGGRSKSIAIRTNNMGRVGLRDVMATNALAKHRRRPPIVPGFVPDRSKNDVPDKIQRSRNESLPSS